MVEQSQAVASGSDRVVALLDSVIYKVIYEGVVGVISWVVA